MGEKCRFLGAELPRGMADESSAKRSALSPPDRILRREFRLDPRWREWVRGSRRRKPSVDERANENGDPFSGSPFRFNVVAGAGNRIYRSETRMAVRRFSMTLRTSNPGARFARPAEAVAFAKVWVADEVFEVTFCHPA